MKNCAAILQYVSSALGADIDVNILLTINVAYCRQGALERNKLALQHIERQVKEQEAQMRDKYYCTLLAVSIGHINPPFVAVVPRCYDEQIRSGTHSREVDLTHAQLNPILMPPHPSTPKTTAHVTIAHNVAPKGFDDGSRPRQYAPYFEDGESEADERTLERFYYAPPPHFRALHSELIVYRLLIRLEDELRTYQNIAIFSTSFMNDSAVKGRGRIDLPRQSRTGVTCHSRAGSYHQVLVCYFPYLASVSDIIPQFQ